MTPADVAARVEAIRAKTHDDEVAHGLEDQLWRDVLEAIAVGTPNAPELAKEALKTTQLDFLRWCA